MKRSIIFLIILAVLSLACGTPKPPESAFPQRIGRFERGKSAPSDIGKNGLNATYESPDGIPVAYTVLPFSSPEAASNGLQKERQETESGAPDKIVKTSESKFIVTSPRSTMVGLALGSMVVLISMPGNATENDFAEFVNNLPYAAYGASKPQSSDTVTSPSAKPGAAEQPTQTADEKVDQNMHDGDVTGAYFAKGTLPAEFSEIEHLSLATIDDQGKPAPLNGFIRPKQRSARDYKLVNPILDVTHFTFSTTTVNGISYSFTGAFTRLDNFSVYSPRSDEVILGGRLTKMSKGKVVAETPINFTYSAGG